jgi:Zn-dependent M28 family amino/carboxypeptidase
VLINKLILILTALIIASCSQQSRNEGKRSAPPESSLLRHLHYLSSDNLQGRKVGSYGGELTQQYLVAQLSNANITPFAENYLTPFLIEKSFSTIHANNVVALIPGSKYPDKFIVLSAHFDHLGAQGKRIFNGADDNASGTSALLHYAKQLKQSPLRHSVILLFTDGEEANLKGAKAFIEQNKELLPSIMLNINVDMIAGNKQTKRLRYISRGLDTILSEEQLSAYTQYQQNEPISIKKGFRQFVRNSLNNKIRWEVASDHGAFHGKNIPFIYFGVGSHNNYHKTSDTFENINQEFYVKAVDSIYQQINFLDQNL